MKLQWSQGCSRTPGLSASVSQGLRMQVCAITLVFLLLFPKDQEFECVPSSWSFSLLLNNLQPDCFLDISFIAHPSHYKKNKLQRIPYFCSSHALIAAPGVTLFKPKAHHFMSHHLIQNASKCPQSHSIVCIFP